MVANNSFKPTPLRGAAQFRRSASLTDDTDNLSRLSFGLRRWIDSQGLWVYYAGGVETCECAGRRGHGESHVHATLKSRGASRRWAARSVSRLGRPSELVPSRHRGQDDSSGGPALHVPARRFDGRRGCRQSRDLGVAAECGGRDHQKGRRCSEGSGELNVGLDLRPPARCPTTIAPERGIAWLSTNFVRRWLNVARPARWIRSFGTTRARHPVKDDSSEQA